VVKKTLPKTGDEHLFRQEMGDVMPLKVQARTDSKVPRSLYRKQAIDDRAMDFDRDPAQTVSEHLSINAEDGSSHRKNGVQKRIIQKLKRGQFPVNAELDLHNMTLDTAHRVLLEFIDESQTNSLECVRIVHGKGLRSGQGPRLKLMTRQLMREHAGVLAFNACKPAEGGTGAMHVLLKKK
jgi:DNA-nicking Smr family endonuclease